MIKTKKWRLILATLLFAVMRTPHSAAAATKVLHFPPDQYMGNLSVEDPCLGTEYLESGRDLSYPFGFDPKRVCLAGDWDFVSPAQGDVAVPTDRNMRLVTMLHLRQRDAAKIARLPPQQYKIFAAARCHQDPDDLAGLSQLAPDALHTLRISSLVRTPDADQRVLEPILHLTDLQILALYKTGITARGMARLKVLRNLRALELHEENISVSSLAVLKDLPALEYFDMIPGTTDAGLKHVAQAQSLRWLRLRMGRIWGPGLAELARLPRLERLSLWGTTGITDRHMPYLEGLTQLKSLTLWGASVPLTDATLASLSKLTNLEELYFIRIETRFTDAGIRHLERLRNLRKLSFLSLHIGAEGMQHLANLPRLESVKGLAPTADAASVLPSFRTLKSLYVNWFIPPIGTPVPPEVVAAVGQLHSIEELFAAGGEWPQKDLLVFGDLNNLKHLTLTANEFSNPVLAEIAGLKNLEQLSLSGAVSKRGLNLLNNLRKLKTLNVQRLSMSDPGIDETPLDLTNLVNLKTLNLKGLALQDGDLSSLTGFDDLEVLNVDGRFTDADLRNLMDLPNLKHLDLRGITCSTGSGLAHLEGLARLGDLKLRGGIPDPALDYLDGLPALWSLTVETDEVIRPETLARLRERLPALEYLHLNKPMRFDTPPVRRTPQSVPRNQRRRR